MRLLSSVFLLAITMTIGTAALAGNNLLFIMDASNSMWGQIDGVAKIETAKKAFSDLVSDIPDDVNVSLAAYGHTDKNSCTDVDFLTAFVDKPNRNMLTEAVATITPKGKTPIATSLEMLGTVVSKLKPGENNSMVLISDGVETCGGDPCKVAEFLAGQKLKFKVHVVGFDISDEDRKQLECIAEKGNGKYFAADNAEGFNEAIAEVVKVAAQTETEAPPPPEPEKPALAEVFRDDFDGDDLADHWEILNPDPDAFIVEDGKLLIVDNQATDLTDENFKNLFLLDYEMPKGDWVITARVDMPLQTQQEHINIGLYDTNAKWIASGLAHTHYNPHTLSLVVRKYSGDKHTFFQTDLFGHVFEGFEGLTKFNEEKKPFDLQLIKEGRQFRARAVSAVDGETVFETEPVTQLRAKGRPIIGFMQRNPITGEGLLEIDWVKIEATP